MAKKLFHNLWDWYILHHMVILPSRAKPDSTAIYELTRIGQTIPVEIIFRKRRTVSLMVYPNRKVQLRVPLRANIRKLESFIEEKSSWIIRQQEKFQSLPQAAKERSYEDGEIFAFLGNPYRLRVMTARTASVELVGDELIVRSRTASAAAVKAALKFWYRENATRVFAERFPSCLHATEKLGLPEHTGLNVRMMKGKWGSCCPKRNITLNAELVAAPVECIDYVIIHELCHLRELNHGKRFYALMDKALPEWKTLRAKLNQSARTGFL